LRTVIRRFDASPIFVPAVGRRNGTRLIYDEFGHGRCCRRLHPRKRVRVLRERERWTVMSETLADDCYRHTDVQRQCRVRMSQVVQPNDAKPQFPEPAVEHAAQRMWMDGRTVFPRDDKIRILVGVSPQFAFAILCLPMGLKQLDRTRIEVNRPGSVSLGCRLHDSVVHVYDRAPDRQAGSLEVNVCPSKTEDFTAPHPRHRRHSPDCLEPVAPDAGEKLGEFERLPCCNAAAQHP
jgi:hypothetical protein